MEEPSFVGENTIPTAIEVHNSSGVPAEQPQRTISQNLRELRAISEGRGLMNEIETEMSQRQGDKQNLIKSKVNRELLHLKKTSNNTVGSREEVLVTNGTILENEDNSSEREYQPLLEVSIIVYTHG